MNRYFKSHFILICWVALSLFSSGWSQEERIDSLVVILEETMKKRSFYDTNKEARIQNLKDLIAEDGLELEKQYYLTNKVIEEYKYYNFDSALYYIEENIANATKLNEDYKINESKLNLTMLLVETGRYKEAIDVLNEIDSSTLSEQLLTDYYYSLQNGYAGLSYYTEVKKNKAGYSKLYQAYQDSLSTRLKKGGEEFLRLKEKNLRDQRKLDEALKINDTRIADLEIGTRAFSLVAFERSLLYELLENVDMQKKYLILSAQSDIIASVKDNASMTVLAMLLFKENKVDKAHDFINFSVADAEFYNSRLRYVNISNILSVISKAYEEKTKAQNKELTTYLILLVIFGLILLVFLFYIVKQVKGLAATKNKLKKANGELKVLNKKLNLTNTDLNNLYHQLSESDKIKENYIGTFLNLYSDYINKLDSYRKLVRKYIQTNKTKNLLDLVKSKQVIDEELNLFYRNFDKSFLHIYPKFIEEINKLLREDEQFAIQKEQNLNTELRILALMRLGITDSARISKILRYSVNTIYNYRVKLKNKAKIERNRFEKEIQNIN